MSVLRFEGKYVKAEDSLAYIDYANIKDACKTLRIGCEKLDNISKKLRDAQSYATKEAFSVNGETFEGRLDIIINNYQNTYKYLSDLADMVEEALNKAYDLKQVELNEIAKVLEKQKELAALQVEEIEII